MTGFEAAAQLLGFFRQNDSFYFSRDFKKVIPITENENEEKAVVLAALSALVEDAFLIKSEIQMGLDKKEDIWVLARPMSFISQQITLSPQTIQLLSLVYRMGVDMFNIDEQEDPFDEAKISETDLFVVLTCAKNAMEIVQAVESEDGEDDE